jgi:hypothetical protein
MLRNQRNTSVVLGVVVGIALGSRRLTVQRFRGSVRCFMLSAQSLPQDPRRLREV